MSNLKLFIFACLAGILATGGLLSLSCSGPTAYKPSGLPELIAFTSNRDKLGHIYTVKPDGTALKATSTDNRTTDGLPAWSPDGSKIAFSSNQSDNYEIWTMNADGSGRTKLTTRQSRNFLPRWSPDGSKIVFTGEVFNEEGVANTEIFVVNSDGSGLAQITDKAQEVEGTGATAGGGHSDKAGWNSVPAWSPDSSKILFSSARDGNPVTPILYTMNPDGSGQQKFGLFFEVDGSEPDWSPANNKITFVRGTAAKRDIWVTDGGSPFPLLGAKKLTDNIDNNYHPVWSPDGKQIAFVSDAGNNEDIFIMNADGSNLRRLTTEKSIDNYPAWRP
jgi:TolB protein